MRHWLGWNQEVDSEGGCQGEELGADQLRTSIQDLRLECALRGEVRSTLKCCDQKDIRKQYYTMAARSDIMHCAPTHSHWTQLQMARSGE